MYNKSKIMRRAHEILKEQRREWRHVALMSHREAFPAMLSAAWQEARNEKTRIASGRSVEQQSKIDGLNNQIYVLRCRETNRISHQVEIAKLQNKINGLAA